MATDMGQYCGTVHILRQGGWSEFRSVDIEADRRALIQNGIEVWPELEAFLREFSGLTLRYERNGRPDSTWFGSARALREAAHPAWALRYGEGLGVRFAPIGCSNLEYLTLHLADDGRFFGGLDPSLSYLGSSPLEMLNGLIHGINTPVDWRPA